LIFSSDSAVNGRIAALFALHCASITFSIVSLLYDATPHHTTWKERKQASEASFREITLKYELLIAQNY